MLLLTANVHRSDSYVAAECFWFVHHSGIYDRNQRGRSQRNNVLETRYIIFGYLGFALCLFCGYSQYSHLLLENILSVFWTHPVLVVALVERWTRDRKVAGSTPGRGAIKSTRLTQPSIRPG